MKQFLQELEWYTVVTGIFTIASAVLTFILDRASEKDGRKKLLGIFRKDLKRYAAYFTLVLAILTLLLENKHKIDEKFDKIAAEQKEERKQKNRFKSTLMAIDRTLKKQDATLKKQDATLKMQDATLSSINNVQLSQLKLLKQQKEELDNYVKMYEKQKKLADSIDFSIKLLHKNLSTQEQSLVKLNKTVKGLNSLQFPLSYNLVTQLKIRIYVDGFEQLWNDPNEGTYLMLPYDAMYKDFLISKIGKVKPNYISDYWKFFYIFLPYVYDNGFLIEPTHQTTNNNANILFENFQGNFSGGSMFKSLTDLYFNPKEKYFEVNFTYRSGIVTNNPNNIDNFYELIDSSNLYVKLKYVGLKKFELLGKDKKLKTISINHVEIKNVIKINYGSSVEFVLQPKYEEINNSFEKMKSLWDETINDSEKWRYSIIKIPIRR